MIGQTISHYQILERLGAGSTGDVYLAEDLRLQRRVALKLLNAALTSDAAQVLRFQQEAQAASGLSHPNILTVFDTGKAGSNCFLVTELIAGHRLNEVGQSRRWELKEVIGIILQIAGGLAAAHKAGIIHCDIKPANLMIRSMATSINRRNVAGCASFRALARWYAPLI